ncbi:hypothetical protein CBS101457_002001 [Exobasidium rhododendri]|nr:hypothetical protein CBS101457_002001 [Exobasidium rhododendri]
MTDADRSPEESAEEANLTGKSGEDSRRVPSEARSRSRSRSASSRSASYSPSPPHSPAALSPVRRGASQNPVHARKERSRSPLASGSRDSYDRSRRDDSRRDYRSIEVSGLTKMVKQSHIDHIFGQYGSIVDIILPTFRTSGASRGRGYVVYRSSASARKAEDYMDDGQIDGAIISVRQASVPEKDFERDSRGYEEPRYQDADSYYDRRSSYRFR